jgi:hypothetical protein
MGNKVGGTAYLTWGGKSMTVSTGSFTVSLMLVERTGVPRADGGGAGYTEVGRVPFIEAEGVFTDDLDPDELQDFTDGTVVAEMANGTVGTLNHAWFSATLDVDNSAGTYTARFEGETGVWS